MLAGSLFVPRQFETAWMDLPVSEAVALVPPRASITSPAECSSVTMRRLYYRMAVRRKCSVFQNSAVSRNLYGSAAMVNDPESNEAISDRLELTRIALEFPTKKAFAEAVQPGMTSQKWSNYISKRDRIPIDVALAMCRKWGLTTDWIYRGLMNGLPSDLRLKIEKAAADLANPDRPPKRSARGR